MASPTLAALDSLASQLVPKLPAATQAAIERTARYYVIQNATQDIGLLLLASVCMWLSLKVFMPRLRAELSKSWDARQNVELFQIGMGITGVAGAVFTIAAAAELACDIPFFVDPVTGTMLHLLNQ